MCSREESNLYHKLRKLASYPLNDESVISDFNLAFMKPYDSVTAGFL